MTRRTRAPRAASCRAARGGRRSRGRGRSARGRREGGHVGAARRQRGRGLPGGQEPAARARRSAARMERRVAGWAAREGAASDARCAWKACGVEVGAAAWGDGGGWPEMPRAAASRGGRRRKREVAGGGAMVSAREKGARNAHQVVLKRKHRIRQPYKKA